MDIGEGSPQPLRDWEATASVVRARALLAHGRFRGAVHEAWKAADAAVRADDDRGYSVVREIAAEIGARASGRPQRNAVLLGRYLAHCQDGSTAEGRRAPLLSRLFGDRGVGGNKICPECAETVRAAARVCRFCGYRFGAA